MQGHGRSGRIGGVGWLRLRRYGSRGTDRKAAAHAVTPTLTVVAMFHLWASGNRPTNNDAGAANDSVAPWPLPLPLPPRPLLVLPLPWVVWWSTSCVNAVVSTCVCVGCAGLLDRGLDSC